MQPSITHQKGVCSSAHRSAVIRGEPDISPHREIKACPPTASHPLLPLLTHRLWCRGLCVWCVTMRVHVRVGESLSLPLNHGGPWGPPVTRERSRPPLTMLPSLLSLPCSSNYITCPMSFYFGNKREGSKGEAKYWSAQRCLLWFRLLTSWLSHNVEKNLTYPSWKAPNSSLFSQSYCQQTSHRSYDIWEMTAASYLDKSQQRDENEN